MATITTVSRLVNGIMRNIDLSASGNVLQVAQLDIGSSSPVSLTKTILTNLLALQSGSDFADGTNAHTHDGRYYTEAELGASSGTAGSALIGDDNSYSNFTPADATIKGALSGIDDALAGVSSDAANKSLSNLDTTSINQDLTPDTTDTRSLGTTSVEWSYLYVAEIQKNGSNFISLTDGRLGDLNGFTSVSWANHTLNSDSSTVQIDWSSGVAFTQLTATTVPYLDASKKLTSSAVTPTELGYLSGVTSAIQTQLGDKIDSSEKAANNGVATLDGGGKIPASQLPSSVMTYEGTWDASANDPELADGTGDAGMVYLVNVAGTQDLGSGDITFAVGDWVVYSGSVWEKSTNSNAVVSVNSQTGVVVLDTDDISEGTNKYYSETLFDASLATKSTDDLVEGDNKYFTIAAAKAAAVVNSTAGSETDQAPSVSAMKDYVDAAVSDVNASYVTLTNNTGSTVVAGTVVALSQSAAGEMILADSDAIATCECVVGVVLADISDEGSGEVQISGRCTPTQDAAYDLGKRVYVSGTAGSSTKTAPSAANSVVFLLGLAVSTTEVILQPNLIAVND